MRKRQAGESSGVAGKAKLMVGWWKKKANGNAAVTPEDAAAASNKRDVSRRDRRGSADNSFKINGADMNNVDEKQLRAFLQDHNSTCHSDMTRTRTLATLHVLYSDILVAAQRP